MCTVSVITLPHGFRLVSNRDEQRSRPLASRPAWRDTTSPRSRDAVATQTPPLRAIWPADRLRDGSEVGTWIAASERGLAMTLLNLNLTPPPTLPPGLHSRGDLIPALIHLNSPHAVSAALHATDLSPYAPFRLIAVDRPTADEPPVVAEIRWDRMTIATAWHRPPVCFASSGLGDDPVQVRLPLFDETVGPRPSDPTAQDAFHAHVWPDRTHLSVLMSRADARTVSTTAVQVLRDAWTGRASVTMTYRPIECVVTPSSPACGGGVNEALRS